MADKPELLPPALEIDDSDGTLRLGDEIVLGPGDCMSIVERKVADLLHASRDLGNGYEWLYLHGLSFGRAPASLAICFRNGLLDQVSWSVDLPGASREKDWPTRQAIDDEVSFVRRVLTDDMDITVGAQPWGEVWSAFDAKGFLAANGVRYKNAGLPIW